MCASCLPRIVGTECANGTGGTRRSSPRSRRWVGSSISLKGHRCFHSVLTGRLELPYLISPSFEDFLSPARFGLLALYGLLSSSAWSLNWPLRAKSSKCGSYVIHCRAYSRKRILLSWKRNGGAVLSLLPGLAEPWFFREPNSTAAGVKNPRVLLWKWDSLCSFPYLERSSKYHLL